MLPLNEHNQSSSTSSDIDWRRPVDLRYTEIGDPDARPLILLVGLGMQMLEWPRLFLRKLSATHRVICVENRDAGQSPRCGPESESDIADIWLAGDAEAASQSAPYSLFDMRDDVLALINALKIQEFNIVGFSMGGMIAQLVSAAMGHRVGAFIQLASNDGTIHVGSTNEAKRRMARLFTAPADRHKVKEYLLDDAVYYGAGHLLADDELRADVEKTYQSFSCGGSGRHALAILAAGGRRAHLRSIKAKTLVLHGDSDPCIASQTGKAAANLIPNAKFKLLPAVGHIVDAQMFVAASEWLNGQSPKKLNRNPTNSQNYPKITKPR